MLLVVQAPTESDKTAWNGWSIVPKLHAHGRSFIKALELLDRDFIACKDVLCRFVEMVGRDSVGVVEEFDAIELSIVSPCFVAWNLAHLFREIFHCRLLHYLNIRELDPKICSRRS